MQKIDLKGQKFGRLFVIEESQCRNWSCLCDCGNSFIAAQRRLVTGNTTSCGCAKKLRIFFKVSDFPKRWQARVEVFRRKKSKHRKNVNPEKRRAWAKAWRDKNIEHSRRKSRASYNRHKKARQEGARRARESRNKDPIRLKNYRDWCCSNVRNKKEKDPQFRIRFAMRNRIWMSMQRGVAKAGNTVELVGCSMADYKKHIESLWKPGMSWSNYGRGNNKWHIDHKIPCAKFDLTKPEEQKKCFHFSNTQPLWQVENLSKGDRIKA